MKTILLILLTAVLSYSYTYLTLVDCEYESSYDGYRGGYVGLYKSMGGNYYKFGFSQYCPYSYTID